MLTVLDIIFVLHDQGGVQKESLLGTVARQREQKKRNEKLLTIVKCVHRLVCTEVGYTCFLTTASLHWKDRPVSLGGSEGISGSGTNGATSMDEDRVDCGLSSSLGLLSLRRTSRVNAAVSHATLTMWLHLCDPLHKNRRRTRVVETQQRDEVAAVLFPSLSFRTVRKEMSIAINTITSSSGWNQEHGHCVGVLDLLACTNEGYSDDGAMVGTIMSLLGIGVVSGVSFVVPSTMINLLRCTTMSLLDIVLTPTADENENEHENEETERKANRRNSYRKVSEEFVVILKCELVM